MPVDAKTAKEIFLAAVERPSGAERTTFLDDACAGDSALRKRVELLLDADALGSFPDYLAQEAEAGAATQGPDASPNDVTRTHAGEDTANDASLNFLSPPNDPANLGRLDHYEVLSEIGRGGMGIVFKAHDESLDRIVAIKAMALESVADAAARRRFIREALAVAAVVHEHVVTIHAVAKEAPVPFLVMQFVQGISLQDRITQSGPIEVKEILRIGMQAASGLTAAHAQGIVHRDIKPANILLENGVERVKITDFGLARAVDDDLTTQTRVIAGTPHYMSPEQAAGEAVDHRSDLFCLGSVLYAMATGHPPFRATGTMAVMKRVIDDAPRPLREVNADIPEWLEAIVAKLHAKNPADRFQSAKEVAELLGQHLAHLQQPSLIAKPAQILIPAIGKSESPIQAKLKSNSRRWTFAMISLAIMLIVPVSVYVAFQKPLDLYFGNGGEITFNEVNPEFEELLVVHEGGTVVEAPGISARVDSLDRKVKARESIALKPGKYRVQAIGRNGERVSRWTIRTSSILSGSAAAYDGEECILQVNRGVRASLSVAKWEAGTASSPSEAGWVKLFNGKDLNGWNTLPANSRSWRVEYGNLVGNGEKSFLVSQRADFRDFRLRAEVRIDAEGDSGLYFRCRPDAELPRGIRSGYESQIIAHGDVHSGSLFRFVDGQTKDLRLLGDNPISPNTWFTLEVNALGNRLTVKVNEKTVVDLEDDDQTVRSGHIALDLFKAGTRVEFREVVIKELLSQPPSVPRSVGEVLSYLPGNWNIQCREINPRVPSKQTLTSGVTTYDWVAGGKLLRSQVGLANQEFGQPLVLHAFDAKANLLRRWFFWSNGRTFGPIPGVFNPTSRSLLWTHGVGDDTHSTVNFDFDDPNTMRAQFYRQDAKNNIVHESEMKFTRTREPVTLANLPLDPNRPAEMKVLDQLVGMWRTEYTIKNPATPNQTKTESVRASAKLILGGRYIELTEDNETNGDSDYTIIWFDQAANKYRQWVYLGAGYDIELFGTWNDTAKTMAWASAHGILQGSWEFKNDGRIESRRLIHDAGGAVTTETKGVSRRIAPVPETAEQVLHALAGNWKGEYTQKIYGGKPDIKKFNAVAINDWSVGDKWLRQRSQIGNESSLSMMVFEPGSNALRDWYFHSRGLIFGPSTGFWDPATRTITWTNLPKEGVVLRQRLRFVDADTTAGEILILDRDGMTLFAMDSVMKRTTENTTIDDNVAVDPPPPEMAVLDRLVGDWNTTGIIKDPKNPDGLRVEWKTTERKILGGRVIAAQQDGPLGDKDMYTLSTFDSFSKAYGRWLFRSDGSVTEYGGLWDEKTQTLKWNWSGKDGSLSSNIWPLSDPNRREWQVLTKDALGKTTFEVKATSTRRSEP
jgi:serine/threonine protein kinase